MYVPPAPRFGALARQALAGLASLLVASCGSGSLRLAPRYVAVHNTMAAMGLAQSGEINEGSLAEGGVARSTVHLRAGDCHTFVAFGDGGVDDIDVVVLDDTGAEVATDRTTDPQAATQFCAPSEGDYQVAVRMARGNGGYVVTSWSGALPAGGGGGGGAVASGGSQGTCAQPIALTPGEPVRGSTASAQNQMTGSCLRGGDAPDVVYSITVEGRAQVSVTMNSDYDGALYLLGACGEMRSEIACNDDEGSTSRSRVEATLDAGTYYLVVDGFGSASGEFEVFAEVSPLQNIAQVCGGATQLSSGQAVTGSTQGTPSYFTATCAGGARSPDRVYSIQVPSRSRMRVRMQSTYDGAIYVRSDCANPNSELACNDDHRDTRHSMLVTTVDPGRYYIYADGFSQGQAGDYSLRADLAPVTGGSSPADDCSSVGTVQPGRDIELDTFHSTDDFQASCGGAGAPDAVYQLTVTNRTRLRAQVADSEFPPTLYVQRTCGDQSTEVACAAGSGGPTSLDTNLQPGTYFLVVDGSAADQFGAARVEVALDDLQALESACRSAPRLRPGRTVTGDTGSSSDRFQATCAGGARSNDVIYTLQVARRSRVRITSEQQYDGAIYLRSDCTDMSTEIACNDDTPQDNRHSEIDQILERGTYYVFVDGFSDANQGAYTLNVDVSRP